MHAIVQLHEGGPYGLFSCLEAVPLFPGFRGPVNPTCFYDRFICGSTLDMAFDEMHFLEASCAIVCSFGKPPRVAEMNSISNSGRENVSDVFSSALWTLDASLEVAAAGAVGVNFHQGAGQNLYSALIRWHFKNGTLAPVNIRPCFYGMVMLQQALRKGSRLLKKTVLQSNAVDVYKYIKVWPLQDVFTQELRYEVWCWSGTLHWSLALVAGN